MKAKEWFAKHKVELFVTGSAAVIFITGFLLGRADLNGDLDALVRESEKIAKETCKEVFGQGWDEGNLNAWCIAARFDKQFVIDTFSRLNWDDKLDRVLKYVEEGNGVVV